MLWLLDGVSTTSTSIQGRTLPEALRDIIVIDAEPREEELVLVAGGGTFKSYLGVLLRLS